MSESLFVIGFICFFAGAFVGFLSCSILVMSKGTIESDQINKDNQAFCIAEVLTMTKEINLHVKNNTLFDDEGNKYQILDGNMSNVDFIGLEKLKECGLLFSITEYFSETSSKYRIRCEIKNITKAPNEPDLYAPAFEGGPVPRI